MSSGTYLILADGVLLLHMAFAGYIIFGFAAVWLLRLFKRSGAGNPWFRLSHLAAMAVVAGESVTGVFCPLTAWEYDLRLLAGQGFRYEPSFLNRFAEKIFYHDFSEAFYTGLYLSFFVVLLLTVLLVPIDWTRLRRRKD